MKEGKYEEEFFQGLAELEFCSGRWIGTGTRWVRENSWTGYQTDEKGNKKQCMKSSPV